MMINPKFGDMVLIARKPEKNEDPLDLWYSDMDATVGTIGCVYNTQEELKAYAYDGYVCLGVDDADGDGVFTYIYPLACLELVEPKLQALAAPEFEAAIASLFGVVP